MIRITATLVVLFGFLQACSTTDPKAIRDPISVYKDGMEQGNKAMLEEVRSKLKQKNAYGSVEPYNPSEITARHSQSLDRRASERGRRSDPGALGFHGGAARTVGITHGAGNSSAERDENAKRHPDDRGQTRPEFSRLAKQTE